MTTRLRSLDVAGVAELIGDRARSAMLLALLDDRAWTAGELARVADSSPQTASAHLAKLLQGGLVCVEPSGRHRYFRLAGPEVAHVLEGLSALGDRVAPRRHPAADEATCFARRCYDHLAGRLGVELLGAMLQQGWLETTDRTFVLTALGRSRLTQFGLDVTQLERHAAGRICLDWTERRHHVGGEVGRALLERLLALGWLTRLAGSRTLILTEVGRRGLNGTFSVRL